MSLLSVKELHDPYATASHLARTALHCLDKEEPDQLDLNSFRNVYRLFQGYRSHGFYGMSDSGIVRLRDTLAEALQRGYPGFEPDHAIEEMRIAMRILVVHDSGDEAPRAGSLDRLRSLLEALASA